MLVCDVPYIRPLLSRKYKNFYPPGLTILYFYKATCYVYSVPTLVILKCQISYMFVAVIVAGLLYFKAFLPSLKCVTLGESGNVIAKYSGQARFK